MRPLRVLRSALVSMCLIVSLMTLCAFAQTAAKLTPTSTIDKLTGQHIYKNAIEVAVVDTANNAVPNQRVKAFVKKGDVEVFSTGAAGPTAMAVTDTKGVAKFGLNTTAEPATDAVIEFVPVLDDQGALDKTAPQQSALLQLSAGPSHVQDFGSKLTYFQLFVGSSFTNNYDTAGHDTGFSNGGQIIRLTFDTMWRHQGNADSCVNADGRPAPSTCTGCKPEPTTCTTAAGKTETVRRISIDRNRMFRRGNWKTDANLEFAKFPFGTTTTDTTGTQNTKGLENAFSGYGGLTWEPNAWAHYDRRDDIPASNASLTTLHSDDWPYDVYRFALFSRFGLTTRTEAEIKNKVLGDTSITREQFGVRFTHRRSKRESPDHEDYNVEPIRFVEISVANFSQYNTKPNQRRVVVDGGLRVGALSNNVFPIYLGIHLNSGRGPDDLRLVLGVLMKLDELAKLVKSAGVPTQ